MYVNGDYLRDIEETVDRARQHQVIEELIGHGGRPRQLLIRTVCILCIYTARLGGHPMHLTEIYDVACSLPLGDRFRLGISFQDGEGRAQNISYRQLEYAFNRLADQLDPSPVLRRRPGETDDELQARTAAAQPAPGQQAILEQRLAAFSDATLEATVPKDMHHHPHHALDSTDFASYGRGPVTDPDAAWGRRPSHQPNLEDELSFGYKAEVLTTVHAENGPPVPELVRRIMLTAANANHEILTLDMLRRMVADGIPPGDLLADSAYPSRVGWTLGVSSLGYDPVFDLHPQERGPKGPEQGALICDGCFYCPEMPAHLWNLPKLGPTTSPEERKRILQLAEARIPWKFKTKGRPGPDGYRRFTDPAAAGKLRCPRKPASMALPYNKPTVHHPPQDKRPCCVQSTITIAPDVAAKTRQKHDYMTAKHQRSYGRRVAVERSHSGMKDPAAENLNRGSIRLLGRTNTWIILAFCYAAHNLRILAAFRRRLDADPEQKPRRSRKKRRTRTYNDLLPNPVPTTPPGTGPPAPDQPTVT